MSDWREKHFGIPEAPKKIRDYDPEPTATWPYFVLALLVLSPIAAVGIAYYLGKFGPAPAQVVDRPVVVENRVVVREPAAKVRTIPPQTSVVEPRPTITQARANELQRLVEARGRGLDLLSRDHAKVRSAYVQADRSLAAARSRLAGLENSRPSASNSARSYEWSRAHSDATSSISTATAEFKRQKTINDSFEQRIAKAARERDDAQGILNTHGIEAISP